MNAPKKRDFTAEQETSVKSIRDKEAELGERFVVMFVW